MRRMVLALDEEGATRAIGPVMRDDSVERIRDLIDTMPDWENYGVVSYQSVADFTVEAKKKRAKETHDG